MSAKILKMTRHITKQQRDKKSLNMTYLNVANLVNTRDSSRPKQRCIHPYHHCQTCLHDRPVSRMFVVYAICWEDKIKSDEKSQFYGNFTDESSSFCFSLLAFFYDMEKNIILYTKYIFLSLQMSDTFLDGDKCIKCFVLFDELH